MLINNKMVGGKTMAKCNKCGYEVLQTAKFCDNCGAKVEILAAPVQNMQETDLQQGYVQYNQPQSAQPTQGNYNTIPPQSQMPQQQNQQASINNTQQNNTPVNPYTQQTSPNNEQVAGQQYNVGQQVSQMPPQNEMPQYQQVQNNIPTQQQYTGQPPMQGQYNSGVITKQKNNKPIIFIGIAVVAVIVLAIVITVNLFSGGDSDDPNIGIWTAEEITMMGMTMSPTEIYPDGITLELEKGNNCTLTLDGEDFNADYEIDGTTFTIEQYGDEFPGTIEGNVITITNLLDMGLDIKFVKSDYDFESAENSQSENSAEAVINENDLTGTYMLSSMTTAGVVMNYDAIQQAEIEMTLEITGNEAQLTAYGSTSPVELDTSAKTIVLQAVVMDYVIDGENIVATGENAGHELVFVFTAENSLIWDDTSGGGINATGFVPPGYGAEKTIPVETLSNPTNWYGTLTISDYVGNDDLNGEYEAWGYLGTDNDMPFFEIFINAPYYDENSTTFLSFYIEQHDYTFFPIVNDEGWIWVAPLKEEDNTWFTPSLMNGILVCTYDYDYGGETFTVVYELAQIDDENGAQSTDNTETDTVDTQENGTAPPAQVATPSFTMNELRDVYLAFQDLSIDEKFSLTYDEVLSRYFNGISGNITNQTDEFVSYQWISIESETSLLNISFEKNEDGEFTYKSMSINNIDYE